VKGAYCLPVTECLVTYMPFESRILGCMLSRSWKSRRQGENRGQEAPRARQNNGNWCKDLERRQNSSLEKFGLTIGRIEDPSELEAGNNGYWMYVHRCIEALGG